MRNATVIVIGAMALALLVPRAARAATPSEACDFVLLSASKAVDARKAGSSNDAISNSLRSENEERRTFDAAVPERFIDKFLRDLFTGEYDQMSSGLELFDGSGYYARRFRTECLKQF